MLARRLFLLSALATVAACSTGRRDPVAAESAPRAIPLHPNETPELRAKINRWADHYELPRGLVHRLAIRESTHNPAARAGPYWGLLQILPQTARTMGFRGKNSDLLDADTNLKYGLKYLKGAYIVADGDWDASIKWYARGYYYEAKRKGLLYETGLRTR
ncbi:MULTISPECIES: transglycosylase SLT domain-containing protein [unclassified Mameliella]|uniref:transglycosylase SLT domain-containing protein n=1 Tax=unclassified Mameliella TaxID=2630630 RepID=UPI00273DD4D6|nr:MULTISPECIES: transglycosylase SLT domain-containing protein [unclassified Mameliella]